MADLNFYCPKCDQNLAVDESLSGSEIECPTCSKPIKIPEADDENVQRLSLIHISEPTRPY